ncbi:hypothetical protein RMATCC62417_11951 [Rhizopus microsporus]|nr:hypothetical protein RMATCC62417_11951 [Rhizopus microsporus]
MEYIIDQDGFVVETIVTHSEYLRSAVFSKVPPANSTLMEKPKDEGIRMKASNLKRDYVRYTFQDKVRFFDLKIDKRTSVAAAANQLGIHTWAAQRWVK